ncbi:MAG TPA: hypothetical protein VLS89_19075 [Candidatus Nanopelagicales bacterium]|nr:hypothetical protein [Candidatus Nanopelagicales bacterium]
MSLDPAIVDAVLRDWQTAPISTRLRAALRLLETLTRRPEELTPALLAELVRDGLDPESIESAANVGFHFNLINRLADAFDFPLPDDAQKVKLARLLDRAGRLLGGKPPTPSFTRGADGVLRPVEVERGRNRLLSAPGVTDPALRRAVESHVAALWGATRDPVDVSEPLRPYLHKLARHAFKITDEDIDRLRAAGHGDEAIYEITFAGAFGAAVAGLERLFEALHAAPG